MRWITKTEDIASATEKQLIRSILTCDGNGEDFKRLVMEEIISRKLREAMVSGELAEEIMSSVRCTNFMEDD
jgi:hypothetical protein